jgi:hypothetical protein
MLHGDFISLFHLFNFVPKPSDFAAVTATMCFCNHCCYSLLQMLGLLIVACLLLTLFLPENSIMNAIPLSSSLSSFLLFPFLHAAAGSF